MSGGKGVLGVVAAIAGFFVGGFFIFFTAGVALFADGPDTERWVVVGVGSAIMFALGLIAGLIAPEFWKVVGIAIAAPVVPIVLLIGLPITFSPDALLGMRLLGPVFLVAYFAAALLGSWLGARLRGRLRSRGVPSAAEVPSQAPADGSDDGSDEVHA